MPAPTADRLKVRCYRCNQLLAVSPTKAGTVVACPKCKADLLIPRQGTQQPAEEPADASVVALKSGTFPALAPVTESASATAAGQGAASSSYLDEIAAVIPPEVAALRPEDLRVEAEFFETLTRGPAPPAEDPFRLPAELSARDLLPPPAAGERGPDNLPGVAAFSTEVSSASGGAVEAPPPLPVNAAVPEANVVVPPIQIEPVAIRRPVDAEPRAIREVVMPASVVLAWLLFVLSAIPMAFIAGLMIGHFLWKNAP
jgi:ribosomal protein S27E